MLLINFSYNLGDFEEYVKDNPLVVDSQLIDFTSTVSKTLTGSVSYPNDLDNDNAIHKIALSDYIHEMGNISIAQHSSSVKKNIRSLTYNGLPLYWLTAISEKHPQNCVLKNIFYFKHLYDRLGTHQNVNIILPFTGLHFASSLRSFFIRKGFKDENIKFNKSCLNTFSLRYYLSCLRGFYSRTHKARRKTKKLRSSEGVNETILFTYFPQTWKGDNQGDQILNGIREYSNELDKRSIYVPFFFDYNLIPSDIRYKTWDYSLFSYFPSPWNTLLFCLRLYKLFIKIKDVSYNFREGSFVDNTIIKYEFYRLLQNGMEQLFNYTWLTLYFKGVNNEAKVFYQDEFYIPGRIVSSALRKSRNKKLQGFGIQHGIIYEGHTVYSITDKEISSLSDSDGIPLPSYFVVWGDYFKRNFLKFNSLNSNFVIIAGYIKYINLRNQRFLVNLKKSEHTITKLLWCTTLKVDTQNQYRKILSAFLDSNDCVEIVVRFHPLVDLREFVRMELVSEKHLNRIVFSDGVVYDDIENSDIVLCTSGSTIFLDALVMEKPIFHLVTDDYFMGDLGGSEMKNIRNKDDLQTAFDWFLKAEAEKKDYSKILDLDKSKWSNVLE